MAFIEVYCSLPQKDRMLTDLLLDRRRILIGGGVAAVLGLQSRTFAGILQSSTDPVFSVADFGARSGAGQDDTRAIQAAIGAAERHGSGTVLIPGTYHCGNINISGSNIRVQGQAGSLVNGRLTIAPGASNIQVADLNMLDTRGDRRSFFLDVSGRNCRFTNLQLVKDPVAGGYQMYVRQPADGCTFDGLKVHGSNGIMVAGRNHLFQNFELISKMLNGAPGDDAFALKGINDVTENIVIRNGIVRGAAAIVSIGSEIGTSKAGGGRGAVRNVTVENVTGDRCARLAFFKPGALDYDYHDGVVEQIRLRNLSLSDPEGQYFRCGIDMIAARGAIIRDVQTSGISINARAMNRGVAPTAAIEIALLDKGAPATIENIALQLKFADPYSGAPHGPDAPGYPVDHIVQIEKRNPDSGVMSGIVLDVDGRGSSLGGIAVGAGLDGAITLKRVRLTQVSTDSRSAQGAGGIWSRSRLNLGDVQVTPANGPRFGGSGFQGRAN